MIGSFIKYHSVNIQQLKQFDLRIVYAETNRVDVGSYPQHLSLHRTYGSRIRRYIHIGERKL